MAGLSNLAGRYNVSGLELGLKIRDQKLKNFKTCGGL